MPVSKGSSTPATTSAPTEIALLHAIGADDFPLWADEPLPVLLAQRLRAPPRAVREALAGLSLATRVDGGLVGALDETWLYRVDARAKEGLDVRLEGVDGLIAWTQFEEGYALVRTLARDAVEREKRLRALHKALGERPLQQLERPTTPLPKRKYTRADWAALLHLRASPWAPLDALAQALGATPRVAKERVGKLVADRAARLDARPRASVHALVRVAPSSTAAARAALATLDGLLRAWVPERGEASLVDATLAGDVPLDAARDIPGVAAVELLHVARAWEGDAIDALLRNAMMRAPP